MNFVDDARFVRFILPNWLLRLVGLRWIQTYFGFWHERDGKPCRDLVPFGWRIGRVSDPDKESGMERLLREHRR